jgi:hypothetical protein
MTYYEAIEEAERRWPDDGTVLKRKPSTSKQKPYQVGRLIRNVFHILGAGDSWEEAFKAAEGRKALREARERAGDGQ